MIYVIQNSKKSLLPATILRISQLPPPHPNYPPESAAGSPLVVGAWPNEGTKLAELLGGLQL